MPNLAARPLARLRASTRSQWWAGFLIFTTLSGLWALATPLFGSPDEPAHVIRAASVARGELIGRDPHDEKMEGARIVDVPLVFATAHDVGCYAFKRAVTADCLSFSGPSHDGPVMTQAGKHPPAYYAVVGFLSLARPSVAGVYAMRLASILLTAALLASATVTLGRLPSPRLAALGFMVAVTPMVLFADATVNPSGPEIAAGVSLWVCGLALVRATAGRPDLRLVNRVGVAASVLVLTRQLSPMWLALIGLSLLVSAHRGVLRALARSVAARVWACIILVLVIAQGLWLLIVKPLEPTHTMHLSQSEVVRGTLGRTAPLYHEMIGYFGWLDTPSPFLVLVIWTGAIGVLLALGIALASRRLLLVLAALVLLTIAIPVVAEVAQARTAGFFWQGRYTLPLAVGIPIVAAVAIGESSARRMLDASRLVPVMGGALVLAHVLAFGQTLRRYTVGYDGRVQFWIDPSWSPPIPPSVLLVAFAVATLGYGIWLLARSDDDHREEIADSRVSSSGAPALP